MLCSVTEVEETKQVLKMLPILISTFLPSVAVAQSGTLFIKQGSTLDQRIGRFSFPPASLGAFVTITMIVCILLHDRVFVKIARKLTKNPRGITLLQRVGAGFILHIIVMIIASVTEAHRLSVAKKHGLVESGGQVPLSIFILLPQFILIGVADACTEVAKLEFFYDQAPDSMKSLGTSYYSTSMGVGSLLSSFVLSTVARVTKENGRSGWILNNLNASRLDLYFLFLGAMCFLNFIEFVVIVRLYRYKAEVSDSMKVLKEELEMEGVKSRNQVQLISSAQG